MAENKPSASIVELMLDAVLGDTRKPEKAPHTKRGENPPPPPAPITDRRDDHGTPYKGDFPNPLGNGRRGCF